MKLTCPNKKADYSKLYHINKSYKILLFLLFELVCSMIRRKKGAQKRVFSKSDEREREKKKM